MDYNGPFATYIVPHGTTVIPSIFMLHGSTELFSFVYACRERNSNLVFVNENIYVDANHDISTDLLLTVYGIVTDDSCNILENYLTYIKSNKEDN